MTAPWLRLFPGRRPACLEDERHPPRRRGGLMAWLLQIPAARHGRGHGRGNAEMIASRQKLLHNLAKHAPAARLRLALTVASTAQLTGLAQDALEGIERGGAESCLSLDELRGLAAFLGLAADGTPRPKPLGANW